MLIVWLSVSQSLLLGVTELIACSQFFSVVSPFGIVFIEPEDRIASRGDNVTFTCVTEAGPGNRYYWFLNTSDPQFLSEQGFFYIQLHNHSNF